MSCAAVPPPAFVWSASLWGSCVRKAPPSHFGWINRPPDPSPPPPAGRLQGRWLRGRLMRTGGRRRGNPHQASERWGADARSRTSRTSSVLPRTRATSPRSPCCRRKEDSVAKQPAHGKKYVASLGSKGQPECLPIITDPEPGVDQQKESIGDGTVDVDVELYEPVDDSDSDIDMGETENKDIMNQDESLMDIDSADSGNPLAATEYVEELYKFYRENEDANGLGVKAVTGDDYC